jgi:transcriptional regulator
VTRSYWNGCGWGGSILDADFSVGGWVPFTRRLPPPHFAETDQAKLHDFIEAYSFGQLVSAHGGEPFARHLPLLLDRNAKPHGTLIGHMAKANPHWHDLEGQTVLAIFSGPHAYISPTWYESEYVVPTWNYVAVHAYGVCRLVDEAEALAAILQTTVVTYERLMPNPWSLDTTTTFFQKMVQGVIGFQIEITRLEGKWKLNQNHPQDRRERVITVLEKSENPDAKEIARLMRDRQSQSRQ